MIKKTLTECLRGAAILSLMTAAAPHPLQAQTAPLSMLHTSGQSIRNSSSTVVQLAGVNLGSWLLMEPWMCPMDSSGQLADNYSALAELDSRFGVATEQSLIGTYQQNWITTTDLDNIKAKGLNCVRCPVWWGDFYTLGGAWRPDAFTQLDWLVSSCASRGIYVIIDMHGVFGGQADNQDTGEDGENDYWTNTTDQSETAALWSKIAAHYAGNKAVSGYDVINEPTGTPDNSTYWTQVNNLYQAIRSADPKHICFIEADNISGTWNTLPTPGMYGWTNVAYSMHEYEFGGSDAQVQQGATYQVNNFKASAGTDGVPVYIGEFNDFQYNDAWQYAIAAFNNNNMSWTMWAYKATHGTSPDSWGLYDVAASAPPVPNLMSDSSATIAADWGKWTTASAFTSNTALAPIISGSNYGGAPPAPTGLAATSSSGQITLSWTASALATSFKIYRGTTSGGESSTPVASGVKTANYTDIGLTNGTKYYYKVAAENKAGTSAKSSETSKTPTASNGPVASGNYTLAPQNAAGSRLDATSGSTTPGTQVQIWTAGAGNPNQLWIFTNEGGGYYKIQPSYDTSLTLAIPAGQAGNGTPAQLLTDTNANATNERWLLTPATGGYTLTPQSAPGYTLNVTGPSSADGTLMQVWQATGGTNTVFALATS